MRCWQYIRITSEITQVLLSNQDWACLMKLASACINRQVIKFSKLQDNMIEWWNKCLREKSFCTSPNTDDIDFDSLYDELNHRICIFETNNSDPYD